MLKLDKREDDGEVLVGIRKDTLREGLGENGEPIGRTTLYVAEKFRDTHPRQARRDHPR